MTAKFWGGGTGNWSDGAHWFLGTGSTGGTTTKPGASDTATFDGASGGGTVTINEAISCQAITWGAFTGTIDNSSGNYTIALTATPWFNGTGSGARAWLGGSGTFNISGAGGSATMWNMPTITNLDVTPQPFENCIINLSPTSSNTATNFLGGGLIYGTLNLAAVADKGGYSITGNNTFTTLTAAAPNAIYVAASSITTIADGLDLTGTAANRILLSSGGTAYATLALTNAGVSNFEWTVLSKISKSGTGTVTATNSIQFGIGTGITVTQPAAGGGGSSGVIGG